MRARALIATAMVMVGIQAMLSTVATAAKSDKPAESVEIICASAPLVLGNRVWLAIDSMLRADGQESVSVVRLNRIVSARGGASAEHLFLRIAEFQKYLLDPPSSSSSGSVIVAGASPAPAPGPVCSMPELHEVDGTIVLDWVVSETDGVIAISRHRSDLFEAPGAYTCNTGEPVADCRPRLRAEVVALP